MQETELIDLIKKIVAVVCATTEYAEENESGERFIMYPNRLEVSNPGGLYGRLTLDGLGKTKVHNPRQAEKQKSADCGGVKTPFLYFRS